MREKNDSIHTAAGAALTDKYLTNDLTTHVKSRYDKITQNIYNKKAV